MVSTAAFHARVRGSVPGLGGLKETKSCNYIFEIIKLYLYHIYVVILFAQPIHVLNYNNITV